MAKGVVYGEYYLLGRLAQGGMAEVFLAKSIGPSKKSLLALKRTLSEYSQDDEFISMFADEARIASGLAHPNICQIYDHGQAGEQRFIVMEFIHGKDLKVVAHRARQRKEFVPRHYTAFVISQMAQALHLAHRKRNEKGELERIVHRDVSPQNVLVSYEGVPKLIDFGIAKAKDRLAKTQAGVVKGKFAYMSPEQAIGSEVDWRTDIFALGVVLYELLVGELPFQGSSDFSTLKKIAKAEYKPPSPERVPRQLVRVIEKSLTRNKEERYNTAEAMAEDLDGFLIDENKEVTATALSSYMRKLFREDYIREMSTVKRYLEMEAPALEKTAGQVPKLPVAPKSPAPRRDAGKGPAVAALDDDDLIDIDIDDDDDDDDDEVTAVLEEEVDLDFDFDDDDEEGEDTRVSDAELAAGYSTMSSEVTGLAELLEPNGDDLALDFDDLDMGSDVGAKALDPAEFAEATVGEMPKAKKRRFSAELDELDDLELADAEEVNLDFDEPTISLEENKTEERTELPAVKPTPQRSRRQRSGRISGGPPPKIIKSGTAKLRKKRGLGPLTIGEVVVLLCAALLGGGTVFCTYYVTRKGVPPFAEDFAPAIEKITGPLPKHEARDLPNASQRPTEKASPAPNLEAGAVHKSV